LTFSAIYPGSWGNDLTLKIINEGNYPGLMVLQVSHKGYPLEVFRKLTKDSTSANYWVTAINGKSEYITVEDNVVVTSQPAVATSLVLTGGEDGLVDISDGDFIGVVEDGVRTGLQIFADPDDIDVNLIAIPGQTSMSIHAAMVSLCESRGDCMCIVDPEPGLKPTQVVNFRYGTGTYLATRVAINSNYAAMYWPWVKGYDAVNGITTLLPPSCAAIRTYIYNDTVGEVWFAPMGINRGRITEATGLEYIPTRGDNDYCYENGVNVIRKFQKYGIVNWGQKTLQVAPTALDRVNVRRLMVYMRKMIATACFSLVGEPNTPNLWRRFDLLVTPFLEDIQAREGLVEFRVKCDEETNTPAVRDRNELRAKIGIKPVKAAEFIIIDFGIVAQGSNFSEFLSPII
jgi:phage tail sheath protein FI